MTHNLWTSLIPIKKPTLIFIEGIQHSGKRTFASALANSLDKKLIYINGEDLEDSKSVKLIEKVFNDARKAGDVIVMIGKADVLFARNGSIAKQAKNALLKEFKKNKNTELITLIEHCGHYKHDGSVSNSAQKCNL